MEGILYYPHVPRAVHRYLCTAYPGVYHARCFEPAVAVGSSVDAGDVVARYGANTVNAPVAGKIFHVGGMPGLHDWPEIRGEDTRVAYTENPEQYTLNNLNTGCLVYPGDVDVGEAYAFSIRPDDYSPDGYYGVNSMFDEGLVWFGGQEPTVLSNIIDAIKPKPKTIITTIDLLVYSLKGGKGIELPPPLKGDVEYERELRRYWDLINNAQAARESLSKATGPR